MTMEPEDPHLIVKCAKSLMTLPYLSQDNIHLIKQIISIAINKGFNDSTVIEAIEDTIEIYRILVDIYEELVRNRINKYVLSRRINRNSKIRRFQIYCFFVNEYNLTRVYLCSFVSPTLCREISELSLLCQQFLCYALPNSLGFFNHTKHESI